MHSTHVAKILTVVSLAVGCGGSKRERKAAEGSPAATQSQTTEQPPPPVEPEEVHPLDAAFREELPRWVIALDRMALGRGDQAAVSAAHSRIVRSLATKHPELESPANTFLSRAEHLVVATTPTHRGRKPGQEQDDAYKLTDALVQLNAALATANVPYYVDTLLRTTNTETGGVRVLTSTYRVRKRRALASGERRIASLDLDRLDTLNFGHSFLGFTRPEIRYALVLTEAVEDFLVTDVLPSIHAPESTAIVKDYGDEPNTEWVTTLEKAFHEDLRAEAIQVAGRNQVLELAAAVTRRRNAFERYGTALQNGGIGIPLPDGYEYDLSILAPLGGTGSRLLGEARASHQALHEASLKTTYFLLLEAHISSITNHEAQHRLDYDDGRLTQVPSVLAEYTGGAEFFDASSRRAESANAELSAYLSQVAREPRRALTNLVYVIRFVMNKSEWGRAESYVALVVFEELAKKLSVQHESFIMGRSVVRSEVARVYMEARKHGGPAISAAARAIWEELYKTALPPITAASPAP